MPKCLSLSQKTEGHFTESDLFFHRSYSSDLNTDSVPILLPWLTPTHFSFLPPSSSWYSAARLCTSPAYSYNSSCRSLCDSALWLMAPSSDDWLPMPVLITPASFAIESSGNGTCGSLCDNMQQDRERHKNSPLVGLPMSEIFISDRRQESREQKKEWGVSSSVRCIISRLKTWQ